MSSFENAKTFFDNCESARGWEACKDFVADGASFAVQSDAMAAIKTVKEYVEAMAGLGGVTMPGSSYKLNASAWDASNNTALVFATFIGTHSGDGGPVPPTNKTTHSDYVFAMQMNDDGKVKHITKIWNSSWAFNELGWM